MPESCTCTAEPGSCSASVAEHVRGAAELVVRFSEAYDEHGFVLTPAQISKLDQSAATYRSILRMQGVDPASRESVGLVAVASSAQLGNMSQLYGGSHLAMAAAKMLVMSLPILKDIARG